MKYCLEHACACTRPASTRLPRITQTLQSAFAFRATDPEAVCCPSVLLDPHPSDSTTMQQFSHAQGHTVPICLKRTVYRCCSDSRPQKVAGVARPACHEFGLQPNF